MFLGGQVKKKSNLQILNTPHNYPTTAIEDTNTNVTNDLFTDSRQYYYY